VARFVAQASTERSGLQVTSVKVEVPAEILAEELHPAFRRTAARRSRVSKADKGSLCPVKAR